MIEYVCIKKEDYEKVIKLLEDSLKILKEGIAKEELRWT